MFNKRTTLKLILAIAFAMFMVNFKAYSQTSLRDIPPATKDIIIKYQISPQKIYQYAKRGQKETIWYLRNFVNMQDSKQMTAICYAQKQRDVNAYRLLKKVGARTDIPCHDDKDTYCIVNKPTKPEVIEDDDSIVPFLLKGAATGGVIWLALELLDSGSSSSCPGGYSTSYPDINSCGTMADKGYIYKQNGQLKGQVCGKCIKKSCDTYDTDNNINTIYTIGSCPAKPHTNVLREDTGLYSGDQECNKCTYTCNGQNAFSNEADCTNNGGYKCYYDQSSTCYVRSSTTQCDTYDTDNDINTIYIAGTCPTKEYTNVSTDPSGLYSGNQECNKCTYTCNGQNAFNNEIDCSNNGGHICKYDTNSSCYIRISENQCNIYDTDNNINTIYTTSSCPTKPHTNVSRENTGLYSGNQECYKCTYTCDENNSFTNPKDCQSYNGYQYAYNCTQDEQTLCYTRSSTQQCAPGYSTEITTSNDCISNANKDNDSSGYGLQQSGYSGTKECNKCVEIACKTGSTQYQDVSDCGTQGGWTYKYEKYSGDLRCGICTSNECTGDYTSTYTSTSECPTRKYMIASSLELKGHAGDTPCNQCQYECDKNKDAYQSSQDCSNNGGFTCVYDTPSNCYYRSKTNSCPTNPTKQSPTYTTPEACVSAFGGNNASWSVEQTNYYAGEQPCYECKANDCASGSYTSCNSLPNDPITSPTGQEVGYSGADICYTCKYDCDKEKGAFEDRSSCEDGGWICIADSWTKFDTGTGVVACYTERVEKACPEGYTTDVKECDAGYTLDTQEQSGGKDCTKCVEGQCPSGTGTYTSASECTQIEENKYGWILESTGQYAGNKECKKCVANNCSYKHSTTYKDPSNCPKYNGEPDEAWTSKPSHTYYQQYSGDDRCYSCETVECSDGKKTCGNIEYISSSSTPTGYWSGSNQCVDCTYKCDTEQNAYEKEENCTENGKYECETKTITSPNFTEYTDNTITCYIRQGGVKCPEGYTTDAQTVSKCGLGTSGDKGWILEESDVESGELKCTKCTKRSCPTNYTENILSESLTCANNGTDIENDGYKLITNEDRFYGDDPCYGCMIKLCTDYNDPDYTTTNVENCGKTGSKGYELTTNSEYLSGNDQCGKCTPLECKTGYYTTDQKEGVKAVRQTDEIEGYSGENPCYLYECVSNDSTCNGNEQIAHPLTLPDGTTVNCYEICVDFSSEDTQNITYLNQEGDFEGINKPLASADENSITPQIRTFDLYNSASSASITGLTDKQNGTPIYNAYASTSENALYKATANATLNIIQQEDAKDNIITAIKSENDAFNAFATGYANSIATINIEDNFTNDSIIYGMYANKNAYNAYANGENALATANININTNTDKQAYGIYAIKDVYNLSNNKLKSSININHNGNGDIFGIYSKQGNITNSGDIYITSTNAKAYGIYLEEGNNNTIENTGNIDIKTSNTAYGIYVKDAGTKDNFVKIYNKGNINITANNDSRGIKIENNGQNAYVENQGTITINNQTNSSNAIDLGGATLLNMGVVTATSDLNLDSFNATHILDGGKYIANSITGSTLVSVNSTLDNNKDEIIEKDSFITKDASNVNVSHQSAMYNTKLVKTQNDSYDIASERKNFNEFTSNKSLANYLEANYKQSNLNDVYNLLKQTSNNKDLSQKIQKISGSDIIPLLPQENISALRHISEVLTNSILAPTSEIKRVVGGADFYHLERDETSLLTGYDNNTTTTYMFGDKQINTKNRLGLGLAIMTSKTNYDNSSDKTENFINLFIPWIHKFKDNLNLASIFNLGYGFGHFDRRGQRADLKDYVYAFTNRITYEVDLNGYAMLEPQLFLNTVGYYQTDINEKNSSNLRIKQANHLSVEAGFGLYLKKKLLDNAKHKLSLKIGGAYYQELSDPYNHMSANIIGGNGIYRIDDGNIYDHNRAVLDASLDYQYKSIDMYLKYYHLIQENKSQMLDFGVKYNF